MQTSYSTNFFFLFPLKQLSIFSYTQGEVRTEIAQKLCINDTVFVCTLRCTGISPYLGKYAQFRCLTYVSVGHNETFLVTIHVGFLHCHFTGHTTPKIRHTWPRGGHSSQSGTLRCAFSLSLFHVSATTIGAARVPWSFSSRLNPPPPSAWPVDA